ncbi:unknown [Firmicutes bacterium CAG:24]|nr:unknown [Firmicutes bacterium CAG:24]
MNQTEIMKAPRDCFAVLQLFPEPYRQKVRMALESAGGRGVPDRQPLKVFCRTGTRPLSAARHTAASATPVACRKSASASDVRFCFT